VRGDLLLHKRTGLPDEAADHRDQVRQPLLNLYRDTAPPGSGAPPLQGERRTRVLVIGGGFTGLSAALSLAERGVSVVLCEAGEIAEGASGRNGGQVNPGLKPDPDAILASYGEDLGLRMLRLAGGAPDLVFSLIARHRIECEARRCGMLRAATHPRLVPAVQRTAEQYQRLGAPVEYLPRTAIAEASGTDRYHGALLDRRGGAVNPLAFAHGLARAAQAAGAVLHGQSRVLSLTRAGGGWSADCASGSVQADSVLLATNGYTDGLWPDLSRTLVPVFSSIAATEPLPASVAGRILPGGQVLWESGTVTVYYRLDAARRLLIGGRGPMREIAAATDIAYILRYARRLWPALEGVAWTHGWSGQLGITRDHVPHLHNPEPGLWICLGYNGRGVALGTVLGAHVAARIADPAAPLDLPVSRLRPISMHGFWRLGVRAVVAAGRLRDALGI
jgi:glycine/D-amino acid oxidase-like deaminating enzyme